MNLQHIDEFLEQHSAGWKPFSGDFKLNKGSLKELGKGLLTFGIGSFAGAGAATGGAAEYGRQQGQAIKAAGREVDERANAAQKASHDAEVAQLAQNSLGAGLPPAPAGPVRNHADRDRIKPKPNRQDGPGLVGWSSSRRIRSTFRTGTSAS